MRIICISALILITVAPLALAAPQEEVETYLVAPYTKDKIVTVTMSDGKKVQGKVVRGDDDKIVVQQGASTVDLATSDIASVSLRRPKRSAKIDFVGNLVGGVGFGFAGAAIGKYAAQNIHSDGTSGRVGPIMGGLVFGLAGGYLGRTIARHAASEDVTLKVVQDSGEPRRRISNSHPAPSVSVQNAVAPQWVASQWIKVSDVPSALAETTSESTEPKSVATFARNR